MVKVIPTFLFIYLSALASGQDRPQFRGPLGNGHAESNGLPTKWDQNTGVAWKIMQQDLAFGLQAIHRHLLGEQKLQNYSL
mgnify:CR=1 FL=1